jgi:hypothetical protein
MLSRIKSPATVSIVMAVLVFAVSVNDAFARTTRHKTVVIVHPVYPPPSPYAPYYYSAWNPFSVYSVYDHLSGGRQQCQLPTEPCDNQHRVTN